MAVNKVQQKFYSIPHTSLRVEDPTFHFVFFQVQIVFFILTHNKAMHEYCFKWIAVCEWWLEALVAHCSVTCKQFCVYRWNCQLNGYNLNEYSVRYFDKKGWWYVVQSHLSTVLYTQINSGTYVSLLCIYLNLVVAIMECKGKNKERQNAKKARNWTSSFLWTCKPRKQYFILQERNRLSQDIKLRGMCIASLNKPYKSGEPQREFQTLLLLSSVVCYFKLVPIFLSQLHTISYC